MNTLLSNSFRDLLETLKSHKIANILLEADYCIKYYNDEKKEIDKYLEINDEQAMSIARIKTIYLNERKSQIDDLINDSISMLTYKPNEFEISFLPKGKEPIINNNSTWSKTNRQSGKPTKIIKKLINDTTITDREYELFNNDLKNKILENHNFKILEGPDILKGYQQCYYNSDKGTLGNSCMINKSARFFDIYVDNAKLLTLWNDSEKLIGRALLWEIDDRICLDRIYTEQDYLVHTFITYAKQNNWCYRDGQYIVETGDDAYWYTPDTDYENSEILKLEKQLKQKHYSAYPYFDTFKYMSDDKTHITCNYYNTHYILNSTQGGYEDDYEDDIICETCDCCGADFDRHPDDNSELRYIEDTGEYCCTECCVYSSYLDKYILRNDSIEFFSYNNNIDYTLQDDFDLDIICVDNNFYHINSSLIQYDEEKDTYILK